MESLRRDSGEPPKSQRDKLAECPWLPATPRLGQGHFALQAGWDRSTLRMEAGPSFSFDHG
eukprot:10930026-Alexandrium_andersonii.AAC.1